MKYILRKSFQSDELDLIINQDDYASYKESQRILFKCLELEESYEVLIVAYLDLERQVYDATASKMIHKIKYPSLEAFDIRLALNLRLMSLLTATTLYRGRLSYYLKECLPNRRDAKKLANSIESREEDSLDYQFMRLFRSHVQHFDLPIHWMSSGTRWTELGKDGLLEYSMDFGVLKSYLMEDKKFTRSILDAYPDKIDLKSTTRNYVESFSKIHCAARELIDESVHKARQEIERAYTQYRESYGEFSGTLIAYKLTEQDIAETVELPLYLDDIRIELRNRNQPLHNLSKWYVTGK